MASKMSMNILRSVVIPIESDRPIPHQNKPPEEEMGKKATQTIYEQLKEVRLFLSNETEYKNLL